LAQVISTSPASITCSGFLFRSSAMGAELSTIAAVGCVPCPELEREWESESQVETSGRPTVIIFDWDDTLLCSTAVRLEQWAMDEVQNLEVAIETILRKAMSLGETLIVTNGNGTWVQDSARRFLPGLLPILSQLKVVSARALYEDLYPGDPFMWKHAAFEQLLTRERTFSAGINLVVMGDQFPEIDAAHQVTQVMADSLVKTVKFQEAPSVGELLGQLSRMEQSLGKIVKENQSQDYGLVMRHLPPFFEHLVASASGWECARAGKCDDYCVNDPVHGVKSMLSLMA